MFASCGSETDTESKMTYLPDDSGLATESPAASSGSIENEPLDTNFGGCGAEEQPEAIISLSPTATEMLYAVGAGPQVAAVDNYSYWPPEAPVIEDLSGFNPNVEAIAGLEPDLVVLSDSGIQEELELLGIQVLVAEAATELEDVYDQMLEIGELTCQRRGASEAVQRMRASMSALAEAASERGEGLTYFHELDDTLYSVTSSTFIGQIYSMTGLQNIADPADEDGSSWGYPQLTQEFILDADPDIIFFADAQCCGQTVETISERPGWSELTAVRNQHVFEMDADIASRWGPRLVQFLETVLSALETVAGP